MAYANDLTVVTAEQLEKLRSNPARAVDAALIVRVSHLLASWITLQPLGGVLREILDGGQPLAPSASSAPRFHSPVEVQRLTLELENAWRGALANAPPDLDANDWYNVEIRRVLHALQTARDTRSAIVSSLSV